MKLLNLLMVVVVGLGLAGCGGSRGVTVRQPSSLMSFMGDTTVALVYKGERGTRPFCTGVWVAEDAFLTANHCVEDEDNPDGPVGSPVLYLVQDEAKGVLEEPAATHLAKVVAADADHDLALVRVEKGGMPGHAVAEVATSLPGVGEHVYMVGHVKGLWWSFVEGVVSGYRESLPGIDKSGPFVQLSAPIWKGNSGGGAFDSDGKLVGICSFGISAPLTNFYVHASSIHSFLKNNL